MQTWGKPEQSSTQNSALVREYVTPPENYDDWLENPTMNEPNVFPIGPIPDTQCMVYLPTFSIKINHKCREIYQLPVPCSIWECHVSFSGV